MPLTAVKFEKVYRLLLAVEQRWDNIGHLINAVKLGTVGGGGASVNLTVAQIKVFRDKASVYVSEIEAALAGLETEVRGSTTLIPGPPGAGITDLNSASAAYLSLVDEKAGNDLRQSLTDDLRGNLNVLRGTDGEFTAASINADQVAVIRQVLELRIDKSKLVLAQLRALGA